MLDSGLIDACIVTTPHYDHPGLANLWQWIYGMPVKVQSHLKYGLWHDDEVEDDVTTLCGI